MRIYPSREAQPDPGHGPSLTLPPLLTLTMALDPSLDPKPSHESEGLNSVAAKLILAMGDEEDPEASAGQGLWYRIRGLGFRV